MIKLQLKTAVETQKYASSAYHIMPLLCLHTVQLEIDIHQFLSNRKDTYCCRFLLFFHRKRNLTLSVKDYELKVS